MKTKCKCFIFLEGNFTMKKIILSLGLFICILNSIVANEQQSFNVPNLLIHKNNTDFINYVLVQNPTETLTLTELKNVLSIVPENAPLLKKAKGHSIAMWSCLGIGLAGTAISLINNDTKIFENQQWITPTAITATVVGVCGMCLNSLFANANFIKAADNYNLYILGIPVIGSK